MAKIGVFPVPTGMNREPVLPTAVRVTEQIGTGKAVNWPVTLTPVMSGGMRH